MPNKRKKGRKTASIVLDDETWTLLKQEANKRGTNVSNLLEELTLTNLAKDENSKNNTENKKASK